MLRGVFAGLGLVGLSTLFLLTQFGSISPQMLTVTGIFTFISLLIAGGFAPIQQLLMPGDDSEGESANSGRSEWWVARATAPLKESWNRWSDAVVILGFGITGICSFVLLVTDQGDTPPLGLLFVGFICSGTALFSLALLAE
jgi:hypothetical protein